MPDATTLWLFREALAQAGLIDKLFERFGQHLGAKGYIARGGQIVDASIVSAPKQPNTKEENEAIKAGTTPEDWQKKPAKNAQKDKDARWTKKHGQSYFGYKNHVGVDKAHKLVRRWAASDASPHDSQKLDDILDASNTGKQIWADTAYRLAEIEARLREKGYKSRICRRAARNRPLSEREEAATRWPRRGMRGVKKGLSGPHPCTTQPSAHARGDGKGHCSRFPLVCRDLVRPGEPSR